MENSEPYAHQLNFMQSLVWNNFRASVTPSTKGKWIFQHALTSPYFPLANTVVIRISPHIVAARLCHSLRLRSVQARYDGPQATCTTSSYLKYLINLYDDIGGNTIMEVVRIGGCGFEFQREREAVIASAQGKGGIPPSSLPVMLKVPDALLQDYSPPTEREHENMLMTASNQLHSKRLDVQMFVLQTLSTITCSDKVNQESAQIMSKLIMKNAFKIQEHLVSILASCLLDYDDHNVQLVHYCLTSFSNALSLLSDLELLSNFLIEYKDNDDFVENVIPHLMKVVSRCKYPHNACLALRCLRLLYNNSAIAQDILENEPQGDLKEAENVGRQTHMQLQIEAQALLETLR